MASPLRPAWRCLRCRISQSSEGPQIRKGAGAQWRTKTTSSAAGTLSPTPSLSPKRQRHNELVFSSRQRQSQRRTYASSHSSPADEPGFRSIVDDPPVLVRAGRKRHSYGIIVLALIPITAFALGTWQVQRLTWKTDLIARFEDRLTRPPLPLPPYIDEDAVSKEFDYRRVLAKGKWRHDLELLVGPRIFEGEDGYNVITPLERTDGSTVLVQRGWIAKKFRDRALRDSEALPEGEIVVEGLLREPLKGNIFTPANRPDKGEWYFPDIKEMAAVVTQALGRESSNGKKCQAIWVEETMETELMETMRRQSKGIPIGRPPEVNLRNNHGQYIFTWYSLSLATTVMLWMVLRKKPSSLAQRVRRNREW